MKIELDEWQREVLNTKGNLCLRSGRQTGKSTIISIKAAEFAVKNPKKTILIIASVERQAQLLFEKTLFYLQDHYKDKIKKGKDRPTKHKLELINGTRIYSLPTGMSGYGIRGYTIDMLIADEAAFIPEEVWSAVTPMLATTKGNIILLSTPYGKGGYFYRCFQDTSFKGFHVSSEDCPRIDKEFLKRERERMSKLQYAQEYLGEFVDELMQFFPDDLIIRCMHHSKHNILGLTKSLGVDVARRGGDETALASFELVKDKMFMIDLEVSLDNLTTETARVILDKDKKFNYKKIFIDDGGLGVAVFDILLEDLQTKRKVVAINNSSRSIEHTAKKSKRLLKEDLYNNLRSLMERGKVVFYDDDRIFRSLKSIQSEYKDGQLKIFGRYSHITEAIIRAVWIIKYKNLNIWIY